jgi:response regulator RpfG family c-di-GMP phosphodiesterase
VTTLGHAPNAPATVLAVDDDPSVLAALRRLFRTDAIQLYTAPSGDEALLLMEQHADELDVVISDYMMPGMDGAELLRAARLRWPDVTRVLLTGNADLPSAARAMNEGQMSYLATKPWHPDEFRAVVTRAVDQRRMLAENRRLRQLAEDQGRRLAEWHHELEATVKARTAELEAANASLNRAVLDTVRLLTTFMEQRLPEHAEHARETARLAGRIAERAALSADEVKRIKVAALIHDIGLLRLPVAVGRGTAASLPMDWRAQYQQHAELGQQLLSTVERLAEMGRWIRHHHERWDGKGYPDQLSRTEIPVPARIIGLASAFLEQRLAPAGVANWLLQQRSDGQFDPDLVQLLEEIVRREGSAAWQ